MGIVPGRIWVMDGSIGAHSVCHKLLLDEILQELDLFPGSVLWAAPPQIHGQARTVLCGFWFPPQLFHQDFDPATSVGGGWQKNLPPPKALFAGVVVLHPVILVEHPGTAQIGRSSYGGASGSTADYLSLQMINRHKSPCPF